MHSFIFRAYREIRIKVAVGVSAIPSHEASPSRADNPRAGLLPNLFMVNPPIGTPTNAPKFIELAINKICQLNLNPY